MIKPVYSPYEVLGIEPGVPPEDIKRRYKELIREFSPEKAPEQFSAVREAYEKLSLQDSGDYKKFPIYRRPLEWLLETETQQRMASVPERKPLAVIFETPYNTQAELRNLVKKGQRKW